MLLSPVCLYGYLVVLLVAAMYSITSMMEYNDIINDFWYQWLAGSQGPQRRTKYPYGQIHHLIYTGEHGHSHMWPWWWFWHGSEVNNIRWSAISPAWESWHLLVVIICADETWQSHTSLGHSCWCKWQVSILAISAPLLDLKKMYWRYSTALYLVAVLNILLVLTNHSWSPNVSAISRVLDCIATTTPWLIVWNKFVQVQPKSWSSSTHQYFGKFLSELTVLMGLMTSLGGAYISKYLWQFFFKVSQIWYNGLLLTNEECDIF